MAPDATTEKIRDENKSRFNSRQAVRSNSFMSKEAPGGGKSRQQNKNLGKSNQKKNHTKTKNRLLTRYRAINIICPSFLSFRPPLEYYVVRNDSTKKKQSTAATYRKQHD